MPIQYPYEIIKRKAPLKEEAMRVRMKQGFKASFDGNTVQALEAGKSYDVPESQAKRWIDKGLAEEDRIVEKAPETKPAVIPETKTAVTKKRKRSTKKK